jgi:predicted phosphoribosyltransferase
MYTDRTDAGRQLAREAQAYREENPIVLALPRGGVVVGYEIAAALDAPLDVMVVRKLGAPGNPEFGFGALAPDRVVHLDERTVSMLGLTQEAIQRVVDAEREELQRRLDVYRGDRPEPELADRTVLLVDDGLATGVTAKAAARAVRRRGPRRVVLAVPVAAPSSAQEMTNFVDEVICPLQPPHFAALSQWYRHFGQTTDAEVVELLQRSRARADPAADRPDEL